VRPESLAPYHQRVSEGLVTAGETERTRAGLREWFARRGMHDAQITVHPGPQATGASHETILFDVTHDGATQSLVARVDPGEDGVFPQPDLFAEYRLLDALSRTDVPLPGLHAFEPDASLLGACFYVMDRVDGVVAGDSPPYTMMGWLHDARPDERRRVWFNGLEAMARVHMVDASGLEFVNRGRPPGLDGEIEYWRDYALFAADDLVGCARRAWDWLMANKPEETDIALCWGDSRLGNQLFDGGRCAALLDWEMATLSDPVQDLAWFVYFDDVFTEGIGVPHLDGIPSQDETIARYEAITQRSVRNFEWFYVFAAYRFVAIMQRIGRLMIRDGRLPADSTFPVENFSSVHLDRICEQKGIP
jgi:aminoglycoside phosphotransferase (APT) family kinase protein